MKFFQGTLVLVITSMISAQGDEVEIVNGREINIKEAPYQVYYDGCGGTILSKRVIATAAHCVNPARKFIRAGSSNADFGGQKIRISKTFVHPKCGNRSKESYDFGVLILKRDLIFNRYIQPIPLAREPVRDGTSFFVTGWGLTETGHTVEKLRGANVKQINLDLCKEHYRKVKERRYKLDESMICAGFLQGGTDACLGDSGGPLVFNKILYGVVSFGYGCAAPGYPGLYGNVPMVYDWYMRYIRDFE